MLNNNIANSLRAFGSVIKSWPPMHPLDKDRWMQFVANAYPYRNKIQKGDVESFLGSIGWTKTDAVLAEDQFWQDVQLLNTFFKGNFWRRFLRSIMGK